MEAHSGYYGSGVGGCHRSMAELLAGEDIADMHFHYNLFDACQSVGNGEGVVGICTGVDYDTLAFGVEAELLESIDYLAFAVALEIDYFLFRECRLELVEIVVEALRAVDFRLAPAEQVKVGSVDYQYHY